MADTKEQIRMAIDVGAKPTNTNYQNSCQLKNWLFDLAESFCFNESASMAVTYDAAFCDCVRIVVCRVDLSVQSKGLAISSLQTQARPLPKRSREQFKKGARTLS